MSRTLKPNLIKFSCPACGTRLAVPLSMAGREDHCPKCSARVAAPVPVLVEQPAEPQPPMVPPAEPEKQVPPNLDAPPVVATPQTDSPPSAQSSIPSTDTAVAPEDSSPGLINNLLDEFLSGPPGAETAPEPAPKPQRKSRARQSRQEVAPEPAALPEPAPVEPALAESPLASDPGPIDAATPFDQPFDDSWSEPPAEILPDIGMGDALAFSSPPPVLNTGWQPSPSLGIGLLDASDMSRTDRRSRRSRIMIFGVLLFLVFDVGIALWFFRQRIQEWWTHGDAAKVKQVTSASAVSAHIIESPAASASPVEPPVVVMPKPDDAAVATKPPESPIVTGNLPASRPETPPVVAPIEPTPVKVPDVKTDPAPVIAKIEIDPPPPPPPAPVIPDISPPSDPAPPTPTPSSSSNEVTNTKSALDALKAFLAAPTISERLRWCQKPEVVRPLMEKHYTSHADGPVKFGRIDFIDSYPSKDGVPPYSMYEVSGGTLKKGVLALVEESPKNEHRVDWETFVEFKDGLVWEFMTKPGSRAQKFHVIIRRTHYFDKDVPDVGNKDGFEISQPSSDVVGHVFIERSNTIARQLAPHLGWDAKIPITMELNWRADGTHHWVEIQAVNSFGWRG